jgi:hypothetical protein
MVVLNEDGSREKFTLSSWVGIPRKHELMWIGDDPYMIIEVEYAVSEGFFGARNRRGRCVRPTPDQGRAGGGRPPARQPGPRQGRTAVQTMT